MAARGPANPHAALYIAVLFKVVKALVIDKGVGQLRFQRAWTRMATRAVGRAAMRTVLTKAAPTLSSHIEVFIVCIVFLRLFDWVIITRLVVWTHDSFPLYRKS